MARKLEINRPDFKASVPYLVKRRDGWIWISDCKEIEGGRWEGFVSFRSRSYRTKSEALKNKPRARK